MVLLFVFMALFGAWFGPPPTTSDTSKPTTPAPSQPIREESATDAKRLVARGLVRDNERGVTADDLIAKPNPRGDGMLVYVAESRFDGVLRPLVWMVIEDQAYPLNSPSKGVTPSLPWPREGPEAVWKRTGLDPYSAGEAIDIVFGPDWEK
ncbi:MAG: hypothetical protein KJZ87_09150 [Thermoguttaceae bacterium]|nr:hypothetical protein [Thermoguttaceae bacterium]